MNSTQISPKSPAKIAIVGEPVLPSERWIRVKFGGVIVANSKRTFLLRQYGGPDRLPTYYFPQADVRMDLLVLPSVRDTETGKVQYWSLQTGEKSAENAAWIFLEPPAGFEDLKDCVTFAWKKMDTWYEEDEEIFAHARDPYHRVDVVQSSRHVRVAIGEQTVADTKRPYLLFETGLPTRYYIPQEDVRMNLLEKSNLRTECPYKGTASYWSVKVGDSIAKDYVWGYLDPILENQKIKGLLSFYNERVDIYVDDELQVRPVTPFS